MEPISFELTPIDVEMLREFNDDLEAEQRFIAGRKKAQEWVANSHKVARKQREERLTILEAEAAQLPMPTVCYILKLRKNDTRQHGTGVVRAVLIMLAVAGVVWAAIAIGNMIGGR